jgi:hypothetical protein
MSFTLDLFAEVESLRPPVVGVDLAIDKDRGVVTAHIPGFETMKPETQKAVGDVVNAVVALAKEVLDTASHEPGFWASKLQEMGEMRLLAARSFIEIARRSGIEHEAVKPTGTDSTGQRTYDMNAVTRLANLMRGKPESLKPELKTGADWQEAIEGVKAWKLAKGARS